ncbi:MAG: hypothetical protein BroJett026_00240 [Betaproteobacteria bacterium]|nr:MAG: hypothetical protein BroJett026_00240 [Betaproteobacteria bacterium]
MTGSVEYAWARVAARQSRRPDAAEWHRVETPRSLAGVLDAARGGGLEPWVEGLDGRAHAHAIEAHLRARWRARVDEVARWMPDEWRPAVRWCAWLPDLPLLRTLARGDALPAGVDDPAWHDARPGPPRAPSPLAPLAPAWRVGGDVARAWSDAWRHRWPRRDATLAALDRTVAAHVAAFRTADAGTGPALRAAFAVALRSLFRRATASPAAVFVHLAQCLLDGERLRGELLRRAALPRVPLAP